MRRAIAFLRERAAIGDRSPAMIEGGASFAQTFGKVVAFLILVEATTGIALAAFYSPSTTDAWGSVAYVQDQTAWGWLVRGLHYHGAGAIVIAAGVHLVQTAVAGAYKKPRELVWWLGLLLVVLTLAWAVTGYVLRWDQAGYWANRVELGIAAGTPVIGEPMRDLALGGNDYGNLTLTRFYALHVLVLPAVVTLVTIAHVWIARRHGTTPMKDRPAAHRWPDQAVRDAVMMAMAIALLLAYVIHEGGADLAAPADPAQAYDARPLWYFRWLYELRELSGSAEKIVALVAPAIVGGFLAALPVLDRRPDRAPRSRVMWLGGLAGVLALIGALTAMSFVRDAGDDELAKRQADAAHRAERARALAQQNGVPATGALDVWATQPMYRARKLFAQKCEGCHTASPERATCDKCGPVIGAGHGDRKWLAAFLRAPSGERFWAHTKLAADSRRAQELGEGAQDPPPDLAMKPVELAGAELDALIEAIYAQSGAADADPAKVHRGLEVFDDTCSDCHAIGEGVAGSSGPGMAGLHSRDWFTSFIGNPKAAVHMTAAMSQMPRFDGELTLIERDAIAAYLVWLRTATPADVDALGPLE